jgi:hypothetical protein
VISTPAGDLTTLEEPEYAIPWLLEKPFKSPADYRALLSLVNDRHYEPDYGPFVHLQESLGGDGIVRAPIELTPLQEIMVYLMGIETFAVEWAERRDEVLKLYRAMAAKHRELYPIVARSPALHANYGGNEIPGTMGRARSCMLTASFSGRTLTGTTGRGQTSCATLRSTTWRPSPRRRTLT